jgi:transcriptional regulator with XRE-family HTH domain
MTLRQKFGKRLRQIRRYRDLTQEQLAEQVGVSVDFIGNLERGESAASFDTLEKLAEVLEVEVDELFRFADLRKQGNGDKPKKRGSAT